MKRDQSAALPEEEPPVTGLCDGYERPVRDGTTAPPFASLRSDDSALRLAAMTADTGKHRRTSVSERMSMLRESLAVWRNMK